MNMNLVWSFATWTNRIKMCELALHTPVNREGNVLEKGLPPGPPEPALPGQV